MKLLWLNIGITPNKKGIYITFEKLRETIAREDETPYLIRWHLLHTPWGRIVLHKILLSDNDCPHDHPWNYTSIILKGGYWEWSDYAIMQHPQGLPVHRKSLWYGAGSVVRRKADWAHQLQLPHGPGPLYQCIPCWTLVLTSSWRRHWGFWTRKGWLAWKQYKSTQNCE